MPSQYEIDQKSLDIAEIIASYSKCVSHHVGAVAVKDGRILATGYNGTPSGCINCSDYWQNYIPEKDRNGHKDWSDKFEVHAEMNVISFAAKHGISIEGATLYSTVQPCMHCTKNLINAGITRIVYKHKYDRMESIADEIYEILLRDTNVIIEQVQ